MNFKYILIRMLTRNQSNDTEDVFLTLLSLFLVFFF